MTTTVPAGLTTAEAATRLRRDGANLLPEPRRQPAVLAFAGQLVHFFAVMLWAAAALAVIAGMPELGIAIAVVVVVNAVFSFAQEYRADRAAQRLRDLMPVRARVVRDGRVAVVEAERLVVGDVLVLEAGDRVCADATAGSASGVAVDESALTGESVPVRKQEGDRLVAGTHVVEGVCRAEVTATGAATRLAQVAAVTAGAARPTSPLAVRLHRVVLVVAGVAVVVGAVFFGVALLLDLPLTESFLFAIGVTVALVPEGLLPTVTLSLAVAARRMAARKALVRRLEAVETLGATTFICTDKTGTLTRNEMTVVRAWTPGGPAVITGSGYSAEGGVEGTPAAQAGLSALADSASRCSPDARVQTHHGHLRPVGDPMEVALHVLAAKLGVPTPPPPRSRAAFDPRRRRSSVLDRDGRHVVGAPDSVLPLCGVVPEEAHRQVADLSALGLRLLAVARTADPDAGERDLDLLGLLALQDPPRDDVAEAIAACRRAGIGVGMVTGDHPGTAAAIAREVGLSTPGAPVLTGADLPSDDRALAELVDHDGVVIARVAPEDKLRIARALQARGHVVAMTGDGVNDGPALRAADIGVAMGASGTDVAREAADLVLLDDHFGTIVAAVELGRATFANIRRFLTYHLTDNVAELAPFVLWALSGGQIPLAITVLQVLAIDIGTDLLPALALGAEPANPRTLRGPARRGELLDGPVLRRAFALLGPVQALAALTAFLIVLLHGGWSFGAQADPALLAAASGTAFAAIVLGQVGTAFACRSQTRWAGWRGNPALLAAVGAELAVLAVFLFVPPLPALLGGSGPTALGWGLAALAPAAVLGADLTAKAIRRRR
ncbi:cation-translocating P-type ATPase [Actinokineospora guangxiensis]|uniref:Cation-translocating P-type ATPase n=1 Tax=Actinokineospora guangxiensis TaxID=1490288 RepID=A0ABW0ELB8_9PSEU